MYHTLGQAENGAVHDLVTINLNLDVAFSYFASWKEEIIQMVTLLAYNNSLQNSAQQVFFVSFGKSIWDALNYLDFCGKELDI